MFFREQGTLIDSLKLLEESVLKTLSDSPAARRDFFLWQPDGDLRGALDRLQSVIGPAPTAAKRSKLFLDLILYLIIGHTQPHIDTDYQVLAEAVEKEREYIESFVRALRTTPENVFSTAISATSLLATLTQLPLMKVFTLVAGGLNLANHLSLLDSQLASDENPIFRVLLKAVIWHQNSRQDVGQMMRREFVDAYQPEGGQRSEDAVIEALKPSTPPINVYSDTDVNGYEATTSLLEGVTRERAKSLFSETVLDEMFTIACTESGVTLTCILDSTTIVVDKIVHVSDANRKSLTVLTFNGKKGLRSCYLKKINDKLMCSEPRGMEEQFARIRARLGYSALIYQFEFNHVLRLAQAEPNPAWLPADFNEISLKNYIDDAFRSIQILPDAIQAWNKVKKNADKAIATRGVAAADNFASSVKLLHETLSMHVQATKENGTGEFVNSMSRAFLEKIVENIVYNTFVDGTKDTQLFNKYINSPEYNDIINRYLWFADPYEYIGKLRGVEKLSLQTLNQEQLLNLKKLHNVLMPALTRDLPTGLRLAEEVAADATGNFPSTRNEWLLSPDGAIPTPASNLLQLPQNAKRRDTNDLRDKKFFT